MLRQKVFVLSSTYFTILLLLFLVVDWKSVVVTEAFITLSPSPILRPLLSNNNDNNKKKTVVLSIRQKQEKQHRSFTILSSSADKIRTTVDNNDASINTTITTNKEMSVVVAATSNTNTAAQEMMDKAKKMREEADRMKFDLVTGKIATLESELKKKSKKKDSNNDKEEEELQKQLQQLQRQLVEEKDDKVHKEVLLSNQDPKESERLKKNPIEGYPENDMEVLLPLALRMEKEKKFEGLSYARQLESFINSPEILEHWGKKMMERRKTSPIISGQIELEKLESEYMESRSRKEKDELRSDIAALREELEELSKEMFENDKKPSFVREDITDMSQEELKLRIRKLMELPPVMRIMFLNGVPMLNFDYQSYVGTTVEEKQKEDEDYGLLLEMGILIEHWHEQMVVIDEIPFEEQRLSPENRTDALRGFQRLPLKLQVIMRDRYSLPQTVPTSDSDIAEQVIAELETKIIVLQDNSTIIVSNNKEDDVLNLDKKYLNDIQFAERSRDLRLSYSYFRDLEEFCPQNETVIQDFVNEIIMPTKEQKMRCAIERVLGGWYIRGMDYYSNTTDDYTTNDEMIQLFNDRLSSSSSLQNLQFYYIPDPRRLLIEDIEGNSEKEYILFVTGVDTKQRRGKPLTRAAVTFIGLISPFLYVYSTLTTNIDLTNPDAIDPSKVALLKNAILGFNTDNIVFIVGFSLLAIQFLHEAGHLFVARKDKFTIGIPNLIPYPAYGFTQAITPILSPPKNCNSLFDFALAGPLSGYIVSLLFLLIGLQLTATATPTEIVAEGVVPTITTGLPVQVVQSSALGGTIIQYFLGGILDSANPNSEFISSASPLSSIIPLHPFAVAGYLGLIGNALALLPVGSTTDGARLSAAWLDRKFAFVFNSFVGLGSIAWGLFHFDKGGEFLLSYLAFVLVFQTGAAEPSIPQNDVDSTTVQRQIIGFLVLFALLPFTLLPYN